VRSHPHAASLHPYIGDITDLQSMSLLFAKEQPKIIFHAAAYKHVPLLELFPDRAIHTNTLATYHLSRIAMQHEVAHFLFISTDKAAEPTSVMGASKRIGELIIQALSKSEGCTTRFCAVRFGNVIGSRGSVVPLFAQQIKQGGPVTVTDPEATRYFMTTPEACGLVIITAVTAEQGKLYLLDMGKPVRILDLANKMIQMHGFPAGSDIPIIYTGLRRGERLHEILVATNEELIPSAHSKIFCVHHRGSLPTLAMITRWIDILEGSLLHETCAQQRERIIEMSREQESLVLN
jgi:FlaA1/EpsC-like NDP-sugar epimerase